MWSLNLKGVDNQAVSYLGWKNIFGITQIKSLEILIVRRNNLN